MTNILKQITIIAILVPLMYACKTRQSESTTQATKRSIKQNTELNKWLRNATPEEKYEKTKSLFDDVMGFAYIYRVGLPKKDEVIRVGESRSSKRANAFSVSLLAAYRSRSSSSSWIGEVRDYPISHYTLSFVNRKKVAKAIAELKRQKGVAYEGALEYLEPLTNQHLHSDVDSVWIIEEEFRNKVNLFRMAASSLAPVEDEVQNQKHFSLVLQASRVHFSVEFHGYTDSLEAGIVGDKGFWKWLLRNYATLECETETGKKLISQYGYQCPKYELMSRFNEQLL